MNEEIRIRGVSRIDSETTHGWFVRGYKNKKTYSRFFGDNKCGDKEKALTAAIKYRDELLAELDTIPPAPRPRRIVASDSRNTTGVLGISRISKKTPSGHLRESFAVTWRPEPGVQKSTSFSIRKYGEKEAFRLAVELRRQKMAEIFPSKSGKKVNKRVN